MSINSVGYAHIARLASQKVYRTTMALISRWYDKDLAQKFIRRATKAGAEDGTSLGDIIESNAVEIFDAYLGTAKIQEDRLLSKDFSIQPWVKEVLARSNAWDIDLLLSDQAKHEEFTSESSEVEQLALNVTTQIELLPRLPRNLKFQDSVWVPRILWALEYAAINHRGLITAAKIAEILTQEGDVDVPNTNVARAFREFRGKPDIEVYFTRVGKKYSITKAGSAVIRSLIRSEYGDADEVGDEDF